MLNSVIFSAVCDEPCLHGGKCEVVDGQRQCVCPSKFYTQPHCEQGKQGFDPLPPDSLFYNPWKIPLENIGGKGKNADNQHILLSPDVFFPCLRKKKIKKIMEYVENTW